MRSYIEGAIVNFTIPVPTSNPMVPYFIAELLQCEAPVEIANFYDRDPSVCDWYYQAYASSEPGHHNSIANILCKNGRPAVTGDIVVVKTGPMNGIWKWSPDIFVQTLAQTLWWYQQSGQDIQTVFNERGLRRLLGAIDE